LGDTLSTRGYPVLYTREPGGTRIGETVRELLLNPQHSELVPVAEALLYAAARAQHVAQV
ncbi:MAG TPA: dTMP kinase, partial [Pelotomaculum sp.]|nr:dTMP kinase [Pelotomaculum sp.]